MAPTSTKFLISPRDIASDLVRLTIRHSAASGRTSEARKADRPLQCQVGQLHRCTRSTRGEAINPSHSAAPPAREHAPIRAHRSNAGDAPRRRLTASAPAAEANAVSRRKILNIPVAAVRTGVLHPVLKV